MGEREPLNYRVFSQYDTDIGCEFMGTSAIYTADNTQLYRWLDQLTQAHQHVMLRLEGPEDRTIGPEDIETDPVLRFALRRGASSIRANQDEIERELRKRLGGLETHPVDLVKANMAQKAEGLGLTGLSERFNVPDFEEGCKIGYEMALADLKKHIEVFLQGKPDAYKIRQIKEARVRGWARLGLDHQGGFSFLPRNEDGTLKRGNVESDPFLCILLRVGIQQFAAKEKEIEQELMNRPGGVTLFMHNIID